MKRDGRLTGGEIRPEPCDHAGCDQPVEGDVHVSPQGHGAPLAMGGAPRSLGLRPTRSMMTVRSLRQFDRADFASLAPFDDGDSNGLALRQTAEPSAFQGRAMHEKILGFALDRDEAEALHGVIPLHRPVGVRRPADDRLAGRKTSPVARGSAAIRRSPEGRPRRSPARRLGLRGARIDADHFR